jgi:hypothetical protein
MPKRDVGNASLYRCHNTHEEDYQLQNEFIVANK